MRAFHVALGGDRELAREIKEINGKKRLQVSDTTLTSAPARLKLKDLNVAPGKSMKACLPLPALPSSTCDAL